MRTPGARLPRPLHPGAWWLWALGLATAASRTTNPMLLGLVIAVVAYVVACRRSDAPWARGFKAYVYMGLFVIALRVAFRIFLNAQVGAHVLFTLPELGLPDIAAGIRVGGPVTLEGILGAVYDGLRLATLLICIGAANVLANPKRLLKLVPGALHEFAVAVTVALTFAPQLVESAQRVRRARRLRGGARPRRHVLREVGIPVLQDALDRSLLLAASMDSRGYGRVGAVDRRARAVTGACLLGGLVGIAVGVYGLLDASTPRALGAPMLFAGVLVGAVGFVLSGRRVQRSVYRPDPWARPEWLVAGSGIVAAAVMFVAGSVDPANLNPSLEPLRWPEFALLPAAGILVGVLPAWLAPPVAPPARRAPAGARAPSVELTHVSAMVDAANETPVRVP
jgi:energy-coupling factor transport system permease protein